MMEARLQPDVVTSSSIVRAAPESLEQLSEQRVALDVWSYAAVVDSLAQEKDPLGAVRWLRRAQEERKKMKRARGIGDSSHGCDVRARKWIEMAFKEVLRAMF